MDNLKKYIDDQRAAGLSNEQIQKNIVSAGWDQQTVANFFQSEKPDTVGSADNNPNPPPVATKRKAAWLWWIFVPLLLVVVGFGVLLLINPDLPAGSDMLKKQALATFLNKGEEVFKKNGQVTNSGLCVFMSMNQSYKEAVSDPTWEFQCFDSDTAYAAQLRLNDGMYRCVDSDGNTVEAKESIINGTQCLQEGDQRVNENKALSGSVDISGTQTGIPTKLPTSLEALNEFSCGDFTHEYSDDKLNASTCLEAAIVNNCQTASFRHQSPEVHFVEIYGITKRNDECTFVFFEQYARSGLGIQCAVDKVLNAKVDDTLYRSKQTGLDYSNPIWEQKRTFEDWLKVQAATTTQSGYYYTLSIVSELAKAGRTYASGFSGGIFGNTRFLPQDFNEERYKNSEEKEYRSSVVNEYRKTLRAYLESEAGCNFFSEPGYRE
jgi:hypothetical protein